MKPTDPAPAEPRPEQSYLQIYSLGKAAANKPRDTNLLRVTPMEKMVLLDGAIASKPTELEIEGQDADGQAYNTMIQTDNALEADWFPMSAGYQQTAPDIRRGELVILWRFGDSNQLYWTPAGLDNHLRKLETVTFMLSGTTDEEDETLSADNSYVFTASTHDGILSMTTSKANNEALIWAMQLNTREGRFIFTDENLNEIEIDGVNHFISIKNADNSRLELDKTNINMHCDDHFTLNAGQSITITTKTFDVTCDTYTLKASDSITMQTGTMTVTSDSNTFNTPESKFTGNVTCVGLTATRGNIGGMTFANGRIDCQELHATSQVRAPNLRYA